MPSRTAGRLLEPGRRSDEPVPPHEVEIEVMPRFGSTADAIEGSGWGGPLANGARGGAAGGQPPLPPLTPLRATNSGIPHYDIPGDPGHTVMGELTLFGAAANTAGFEAAIHMVVHRMGRHFGFQAFNTVPSTEGSESEQWSPATIFVVTDHLVQLLVKNLFRRQGTVGAEPARFRRSVAQLHANMLAGYSDWCAAVDLPERVPEVEHGFLSRGTGTPEWEWQLEELALYFLLWSEGANLRHLPECLWFHYWIIRNSHTRMAEVCCPREDGWDSGAGAVVNKDWHGISQRRVLMRTDFAVAIRDMRKDMGVPDGGRTWTVEERDTLMDEAMAELAEAGFFPPGSPDVPLLAEMIVFGDGGLILEKVVSPIFRFLATEIDKKGGSGMEIGHRIGYDDANECFCRIDCIRTVLTALGMRLDGDKVTAMVDPLTALLQVGLPEGPQLQPKPHRKWHRVRRSRDDPPAPPIPRNDADWEVTLARDWWAKTLFGKTFIEARSFFMIYRAFFRVFAFHILLFQFLASVAWARGSERWFVASITLLTHAALSLLAQWAAIWTQRSPEKHLRLWGNPLWGRNVPGLLTWAGINAGLWVCFVWWLAGLTKLVWIIGASAYGAVILFHGIISIRPGYAVSAWHELSEKSQRVARRRYFPGWFFNGLAWLFRRMGSASPRPTAKEYLAPMRMSLPWSQFLASIAFWLVLLGMKGCFDYWVVILPLRPPIQVLWHRGWLSACKGQITRGGKPTGVPCPDADVILVIARVLPAFVLTLVDTGIFYTVVSAVFGAMKGLVVLNLGVVSNFQELRQNFHKGPMQWWGRCVSQQGALNISSAIDLAARRHVPESPRITPPQHTRQRRSEMRMSAGATKGSARDLPSMNVVGTGGAASLLVPTQPQAQATRQARSTMASTLKGGRGQNVLQALADEQVAQWLIFSDTWNAIVDELRSKDLLSEKEKRNLNFQHLPIDDTVEVVEGMRPFLLPIFFYAGQVNAAAESTSLSSSQLVAVAEMRALLVWILLQLRIISRDQATVLLRYVPVREPATTAHRTSRLAGLGAIVALLHALEDVQRPVRDEAAYKARAGAALSVREKLLEVVKKLTTEVEATIARHPKGLDASGGGSWSRQKHERATQTAIVLEDLKTRVLTPKDWEAYCKAEDSPLTVLHEDSEATSASDVMTKAIKQVILMLEVAPGGTAPGGDEAQRVLSFFLSSLKNPTLVRPPPVEAMMSFNTLTPHYEEDVIFALAAADTARQLGLAGPDAHKGLADLITENEDGVSVMTYMRSLYPLDWQNFLERLKPRLGGIDPASIGEEDFSTGGALAHLQMELQLWASYRGQLLARTVRGMMAYEDALRLLATAETPKPRDMSDLDYELWLDDLVASKYTYVVASQVYGRNRGSANAKGRWLARGVETLLYQYPGLRVAFLDEAPGGRQYSVFIRGTGAPPEGLESQTVEIYRVRLPANPESKRGVVLGEGKPENQNHAIIFCHNEALQSIDMNQDNNLAEALKARNLLAEFDTSTETALPAPLPRGGDVHINVADVAKPMPDVASKRLFRRRTGPQPVALVGFREWIFSENSGALASFAAATEFTFGTIVQRVMSWPGGVRFHYGHPDVWNKLFVMSRGGISKATRAFHISEDVFAGYNHTLRGARTKFVEYISVGKGRDMGFDSINSFESKVAGGNGEQCLSRDIYRLGTQFDFMRLMAWYHTGPGFFINSYLIFAAINATVWVYLLLALTNSVIVPCGPDLKELCSTLTTHTAVTAAGQVFQVGVLTMATWTIELLLERGVFYAAGSILAQIVQGTIMFGIFRSRTSAYYFAQDLKHGGAAYIPTGRGYALKHATFVKTYTSYGRSHIYYAVTLVMLLLLLALLNFQDYVVSTWGPWLIAITLLIAPFWFNPQTFSLSKTTADYEAWRLWMVDVMDAETKTTWFSWNKRELEKARNERGVATHPRLAAAWGVAESIPVAVLVVASITQLQNTSINRYALFGILSGSVWGYLAVVALVRRYMRKRFYQRQWRLARILLTTTGVAAVIVFVLVVVPALGSAYDGFRNVVIIVFANLQIVAIIGQVALYCFPDWALMRNYVDLSYRLFDMMVGSILFAFLFLLSFVGVVGRIQAALLFNIKFANSLKRGRLLVRACTLIGNYVQIVIERMQREERLQRDVEKQQQQQQPSPGAGVPPPSPSGATTSAAPGFRRR